MTGGAGTGKSETLVAYIKAVMWQQGHFDPCIPNPKAPELIHTSRKGGGANRQPPSGMHLGHGPNKRTGRQPDAAGDPIGRPGSCLLKGGLEGPPRALDAAPSCKGPDPPRFGAVQPSNSPRDVGRSSGLQWHTPLRAMALATGEPESTNHVGDAQPSPSQFATPTVNRHAPSVPSNTQLPAMALPTGDPGYATHVGDVQPTPEFIEAVAKLVQKQRVRVKQQAGPCASPPGSSPGTS